MFTVSKKIYLLIISVYKFSAKDSGRVKEMSFSNFFRQVHTDLELFDLKFSDILKAATLPVVYV